MTADTFPDLGGHPDRDEILKAVKAGIFLGYPDGTFRPQSTATRYEVVAAMIRYLYGGELPDELWQGIILEFTDVPRDHWAFRYLALAVTGYMAPPG